MSLKLSVCLAVGHMGVRIAETVTELIDVASELTGALEILIVDDGSAGLASETGHELAVRYPQIRIIEVEPGISSESAVRAALRQGRGEVLLFSDDGAPLPLTAVHRMWARIACHDAVFTRSIGAGAAGDCQMVRLDVARQLSWVPPRRKDLMAALSREGYHWTEVICDTSGSRVTQSPKRSAARAARTHEVETKASAPRYGGPRRPNYFERLKRLALGE